MNDFLFYWFLPTQKSTTKKSAFKNFTEGKILVLLVSTTHPPDPLQGGGSGGVGGDVPMK
jgi:hypothetical protein